MRLLSECCVVGVSIETALFDVLSVNSGVLIWVFDMLAKEYVSVGMFDEAIDALFQLKRREFVPRIMSCNFLMNRLIEHGKVDMALAIYGHLKMSGLNPNDYTYGILLKALCRKGNFEEARDVFMEMVEVGVNPNAFNSHKRSDLGYETLRAFRAAKWPIDTFAYTTVIRGFCSEMKLKEAVEVLFDMVNEWVAPDVYIYGALIHAYCKARNLLQALAMHKDMVSNGIRNKLCYT